MDYLGKGEVLTNTGLNKFVNKIWEKYIYWVHRKSLFISTREKWGGCIYIFVQCMKVKSGKTSNLRSWVRFYVIWDKSEKTKDTWIESQITKRKSSFKSNEISLKKSYDKSKSSKNELTQVSRNLKEEEDVCQWNQVSDHSRKVWVKSSDTSFM